MTNALPRGALALLHGRLHSWPPGEADSILVVDGEIVRVGTSSEVLSSAPPGTEALELEGRIVTPGFVDGHAHFLQSGLRASRPDLTDATSLDDAIARVRDALRSGPATGILVAEGWDETKWPRRVAPTREALDRALPSRPVILRRVCGHAAVANGAALEVLASRCGLRGIDAASGMLLEEPVLALDATFEPSNEEIDIAFAAAARHWLSRGVTTTCDFLRGRMPAQYAHFLKRRTLPLRVVAYLVEEGMPLSSHSEAGGIAEIFAGDERFSWAGRKIFSDGSIGARTAALTAEYADRPGETGTLLLDTDSIAAAIARATDSAVSLAVHAIGDRAIATVLDAFTRFPAADNRALRHRIEHLELPSSGDAERLAAIGVRPCMQPNFVAEWGGPGGLYEAALGAARVDAMNPLHTIHAAGCGLFFGSDGMPLSPLYGIRAAASHPNPHERIAPDECIDLYTAAPAEALRESPGFGRIRCGASADLAVLPAGFAWTEATPRTEVDLTIFAGRVAHRSERLAPPAPLLARRSE